MVYLDTYIFHRFGLSSKFDNDFPSSLTGKVSSCAVKFKHHCGVSRLHTITYKLIKDTHGLHLHNFVTRCNFLVVWSLQRCISVLLSSALAVDCDVSYLVQVASEEFHSTLSRVNAILQKSFPLNLKCFLCGCLCCCCTLGLSLGPVVYLSKRVNINLSFVCVCVCVSLCVYLSFSVSVCVCVSVYELSLCHSVCFTFFQTRSRIEKLLEMENWRLYNKVYTCTWRGGGIQSLTYSRNLPQLGLNLRLHREQCENSNLREYVSMSR